MINQTKFDVITLSEMWLKNDKHLLEYVRLSGYEFAYRNRDEKRGGGAGIFIRVTIEFKVVVTYRNQMIQLNIYGSNSACLVGVFYQPSSENNKKRTWIEKLDSVLSVENRRRTEQ